MLASDDYARVYLRREKAWYILSRDACRDLRKFSLETRPSTRACYNYAWEYFRRQEPRRAASQQISAPLVERIINQDHHLDDCHLVQQSIKRRIQQTKHTKQKEAAKSLQSLLPAPLQRSMELAQEKGASTWLTALPIEEHGFALHKAAFKDSLSLRYVWPLQNSPSHCSCGQPYSVEQNRRLSHRETQRSEGYHCHVTDRGMPRSHNRALPTATLRRVPVTSLSHH